MRAAAHAIGKVYLIGAGPGDVELLTLKAVRALGEADVALVDDLVNRKVLRYLPDDARIIDVGKRGGCRSTPQAFIERQMVALARRGLCVARVKGGDPLLFGRGGEELQALRRAKVSVEIVSGITAGIGVPAALGISLTHRDFSVGVTFVTGHTQANTPPRWDALVASGTTLVIYMGMARLTEIVASLLAAGMSPEMPVAIMQNGTLPHSDSLVSTLGAIVTATQRARLGSPALIIVGKVAAMASIPLTRSAIPTGARLA